MSEKLSRVDFVVQKYRLNELTYIEADKLGDGKLMDDATLECFMKCDPSGNLKYLDWMIFQAGGGQASMEKSLSLWEGDGKDDVTSLCNHCRSDFIEELVAGYTDEQGNRHLAVSREEAEAAWKRREDSSKFEFVMGDQDVAIEEGYGFFRHWPGKEGRYAKIINAVTLWHSAQSKLLAQNQKHERWVNLKKQPMSLWSAEDQAFVRRCNEAPPTEPVILDIYAGWKPKDYSQVGAVYKNLDDLLHVLATVRKMQVLKDTRHEIVYEDSNVIAICPLTIGAAIKFGIGKWCVSNMTEFDRYFDAKSGAMEGNWQRYCRQGPLVFLRWKVPMPPFIHMLAVQVKREHLKALDGAQSMAWVDCKNEQAAATYQSILARIVNERMRVSDNEIGMGHATAADERFFKWGGRMPGRAWQKQEVEDAILRSLQETIEAINRWGKTFKMDRIVLDFVTGIMPL